jgi:hypothetical protein
MIYRSQQGNPSGVIHPEHGTRSISFKRSSQFFLEAEDRLSGRAMNRSDSFQPKVSVEHSDLRWCDLQIILGISQRGVDAYLRGTAFQSESSSPHSAGRVDQANIYPQFDTRWNQVEKMLDLMPFRRNPESLEGDFGCGRRFS